jgi:YebC/PmpR family DNA-binding regulatory protein
VSGHSKWATIKRKKGALDAKRGQVFTKLIRELTVAAKNGGADPDGNPRLRLAIDKAKAANMPSKNIDTAVAKGAGTIEGVTYEDVFYEGYAPGGIAIIVEGSTDNKNRTLGEIRNLLEKNGGNLGTSGSVAWMFKSCGLITVDKSTAQEDELMEVALEAGAEDMAVEEDVFEITTAFEEFETVRQALLAKGVKINNAELTKIPQNTIKVEGIPASKVLRLVELLEDHDDVQHVYANFDIDDKEMDKLTA